MSSSSGLTFVEDSFGEEFDDGLTSFTSDSKDDELKALQMFI